MSKLAKLWLSARARVDHPNPSAKIALAAGLLVATGCGSAALAAQPLVIQSEGSFMAGGTVFTAPGNFDPASTPPNAPASAAQTLSGDHTYVQFQIPVAPKTNAAVMWGSFVGNSWETTPDGREGSKSSFCAKDGAFTTRTGRGRPSLAHDRWSDNNADSR